MLEWAKLLLKPIGITSTHFTADHKLVSPQQTYKLPMNNCERVNRKLMSPDATCFSFWRKTSETESACSLLNLNNLNNQRKLFVVVVLRMTHTVNQRLSGQHRKNMFLYIW